MVGLPLEMPLAAEEKSKLISEYRRADNDTGSVADRHFRELIYPEGHPYRLRTHGYQETVAKLGPDDLAAFHARTYGPAGGFCVVVGDVEFEEVATQEMERLVREGVPELELAKVRRQLRAGHLFSTEGVSNQAHYLGLYEIADSWQAFERYLDDLAKVTATDVMRVAATYLTIDNRTVGWFVPTADANPADRKPS